MTAADLGILEWRTNPSGSQHTTNGWYVVKPGLGDERWVAFYCLGGHREELGCTGVMGTMAQLRSQARRICAAHYKKAQEERAREEKT